MQTKETGRSQVSNFTAASSGVSWSRVMCKNMKGVSCLEDVKKGELIGPVTI